MLMPEKMICEYCEKDAIGYQGFGCCSAYVCLDHADTFVRALKSRGKTGLGRMLLRAVQNIRFFIRLKKMSFQVCLKNER